MKTFKDLPNSEREFLEKLLEQKNRIDFEDYIQKVIFEKYRISDSDLLTKVLDYLYEYHGYCDVDLFKYAADAQITLTKNQIALLLREDNYIPAEFIYETPSLIEEVFKCDGEITTTKKTAEIRKKSNLTPLLSYIQKNIDAWIAKDYYLEALFQLGIPFSDEIVVKLVKHNDFPNKCISKKIYPALVNDIINGTCSLPARLVPKDYRNLHTFLQYPTVSNRDKINLCKQKLLKNFPMLLTCSNTVIRNWASEKILEQKILQLENKTFKITGEVSKKLIKLLDQFSGDELEQKLSKLQGETRERR